MKPNPTPTPAVAYSSIGLTAQNKGAVLYFSVIAGYNPGYHNTVSPSLSSPGSSLATTPEHLP